LAMQHNSEERVAGSCFSKGVLYCNCKNVPDVLPSCREQFEAAISAVSIRFWSKFFLYPELWHVSNEAVKIVSPSLSLRVFYANFLLVLQL
jgi:hypothetical protein